MGGMIDEEKNCYFIHSMEEECRKNGYLMIVFGFSETTFSDQDRNNCEMKLIQMADFLDLKAIIVQLEFIKNDYLIDAFKKLAAKKGIPIIAMERYTEGCMNISMNYKNGFAEMVRHVVQVHGCRDIYMMAGIKGDHFSEERIDAYKLVLAENDIPFDEKRIGYGLFWDRPARDVIQKVIEEGDMPEAVVCANDNMAIAVSDELQKAGYRVPEDVLVTGLDGERKCIFKSPSITTVEPDYQSEARRIVEMIKENEKNPAIGADEKIDFILKLRGSCGCNRSGDTLSIDDVIALSDYYDDVNWAVTNINNLFSQTAMLESLTELSRVTQDTLWLWKRDFQFVALSSDLLREENCVMGRGKYTTFFCFKDGDSSGIGESFDEDVLFPDFDKVADERGISVMLVKLLYAGGRIFGYLVEGMENINDRAVRRCEEFAMLLSTAINVVDVNRNLIRIQREIEEASVRDYLTGIYNRRGFFNELDLLINMPANKGLYLTLFSIDMDGLKNINDQYGHAEGDFAIQSMAGAIHHIASRNGISARYGGDEFACAMISEEPLHLSADDFRKRIDSYVLRHEKAAEKEYAITASIGSSCACINEELDIEMLIKEADDAMYADKKFKNERLTRS